MNPHRKFLLLVGLLSLLGACSHEVASGPPPVHYGQDACAGCGMILSDDRFAAAIINPAPDTTPLLFDDPGCLLSYQQKHPEAAHWTRYFHDADTHAWITRDQALFVKTTRETPMGSGIFVFGSRSAAEAFARSNKASVQNYAQVSQADPMATAASR